MAHTTSVVTPLIADAIESTMKLVVDNHFYSGSPIYQKLDMHAAKEIRRKEKVIIIEGNDDDNDDDDNNNNNDNNSNNDESNNSGNDSNTNVYDNNCKKNEKRIKKKKKKRVIQEKKKEIGKNEEKKNKKEGKKEKENKNKEVKVISDIKKNEPLLNVSSSSSTLCPLPPIYYTQQMMIDELKWMDTGSWKLIYRERTVVKHVEKNCVLNVEGKPIKK
jgi:hypothetical protein